MRRPGRLVEFGLAGSALFGAWWRLAPTVSAPIGRLNGRSGDRIRVGDAPTPERLDGYLGAIEPRCSLRPVRKRPLRFHTLVRRRRVDPRFARVPRHLHQILIRSDEVRIELRKVDASEAPGEAPVPLSAVTHRERR